MSDSLQLASIDEIKDLERDLSTPLTTVGHGRAENLITAADEMPTSDCPDTDENHSAPNEGSPKKSDLSSTMDDNDIFQQTIKQNSNFIDKISKEDVSMDTLNEGSNITENGEAHKPSNTPSHHDQQEPASEKEDILKDQEAKPELLCRLCAVPCQGSTAVFLFQKPPHHPEVLAKGVQGNQEDEVLADILSMIRATLPVKVSCCDTLPKQVCKMCIERLRLSYDFTTTVLKAESQLNSLRAQHKSTDLNDALSPYNSAASYDCPVCKESSLTTSKHNEPPSYFSGHYGWENVIIKDEPQDIEPSHEELEKSHNDFFGGQKEIETFRTEERITLRPSKPACLGGRRPRGRPRSRPLKVTPRGRRGRRCTQTTVEKILELGGASYENEDYGFQLRSKENNPASGALTQCLLCERFLPGAAACLQHSLAEHMDCGAFLCPRCPRDDFPGDFELIQHYQESHCPDLELYEVFQPEKKDAGTINNSDQDLHLGLEPQLDCNITDPDIVKVEESSGMHEPDWPMEAVEYENLNNTPPNELYESQDEMSSNLSELAPRSLTSHSALYEEESNSISTHGSDSNLATEDILNSHHPDRHVLHDKLMGEASSLVDEVSFSNSSCALGVGVFASDLTAMEEESQDNNGKSIEKSDFCSAGDNINVSVENQDCQRQDFKTLQEESQDSLRADELCGFQEAICEKSKEVNLNGSNLHFDSDIPVSGGDGDLTAELTFTQRS